MRFSHLFKSIALALTLGTLAGCGASGLQSVVDSSQMNNPTAMRMGGMMGRRGQGVGGELGLFAGLDLTSEQRAQFKALAQQYRPQPMTGNAAPRLNEVLVAQTLDVEALRSALANRPMPSQHRLDFLVAARGVLTDAQRSTLIDRLKAAPAPTQTHPMPGGPAGFDLGQLSGDLKLTAAQQAAYDAFQAKLKDARPTPIDPQAMRAAMITFLETGDASGLKALEPNAPAAFPADEFVAWVQSLSFEQRKALFTRPFGGPHHGPHGGF